MTAGDMLTLGTVHKAWLLPGEPGRGLHPLMEAAKIACKINRQLLKDHYWTLNSSLLEAGAREVRIGEVVSMP